MSLEAVDCGPQQPRPPIQPIIDLPGESTKPPKRGFGAAFRLTPDEEPDEEPDPGDSEGEEEHVPDERELPVIDPGLGWGYTIPGDSDKDPV